MVHVAPENVIKYIEEFVKLNYQGSTCTVDTLNLMCNVENGDISLFDSLNASGVIAFAEVRIFDRTNQDDLSTLMWEFTVDRPQVNPGNFNKTVYLFSNQTTASGVPIRFPFVEWPYMFMENFQFPTIMNGVRGTVAVSGYKVTINNVRN